MTVALTELCLSKKIVIFVGEGGVGKTTVAAAVALHGAKAGRRVACLTIDPARRLADSLGLRELEGARDIVDATSRVREAGVPVTGTLGIGMLDARATFDELIRQRAGSADKAERILNNRLYRYVSSSLSGMQEYMALERLSQLRVDQSRDLIVLDTPPSSNAIDFFSAPGRMREALDGPLVRVMRRLAGAPSRMGFDLMGRWAHAVLGVLGKMTGASLLKEIMEFVDALSDIFGDFFSHAVRLENTLNAPDVAIVIVSRPGKGAFEESLRFKQSLASLGFSIHGMVINQLHHPLVTAPCPEWLPPEEQRRVAQINEIWNRRCEAEQNSLEKLRHAWPELSRICGIPLLADPAGSIRHLERIQDAMFEIQG